ncbi:MAG: hypothetical protein K2X77_26880 [Candidatus Obscuribacterales bacterium]|jgi:hypothetical protein|nr:hypothetical protein [Candidatus Obscuribacterales bacterium]
MTSKKLIILTAMAYGLASPATFAQGNDFFGSSVPGSGSNIERPPGVQAAEQQALQNSHAEYTSDEKRMQKKYKANLRAAQDLITKGEKMLKDGEKKKDDKMQKKGKILKEVGEKRVQELKESNPSP